jgi:16S rRNA (cytosine967-C5)-methyltransferase
VSGQNPREIAVQVLRRRQEGEFVENLLDSALERARLPSADRGLCQELVYGIVRWQTTLDWLIARKTRDQAQKPSLQDLLRLGLYQIFWLDRIPNHAAVNETVELAKRNRLSAQAGFINAVLRGYLREFDATKELLADLKVNQPHIGYSHPDWLVERWQKQWDKDLTLRLLEWNNSPPKTFARVNMLKADPGKLLSKWRDEDVEYDFVRYDWIEENLVFELKSHPPLARLPSFQQGLFYIQDPSTLLAVKALDPKPGETILDLCAAPGGKLTYIAQLMNNDGQLVAHDLSPERLKLVDENCARLGVNCVQTTLDLRGAVGTPRPTIALKVGRGVPTAPGMVALPASLAPLPSHFDKILLDAPCSNTGVMRRRVDLRWRIKAEEISRLRSIQFDLLKQAASILMPRGVLVYSTCSLESEENQSLVGDFLSTHTYFKLEIERELTPFTNGVDGAYVARFRKIA